MATTIKRFEDILKTELTAMHCKFAFHMITIQNMCQQRDQKQVVNEHTSRLDALEQQVTDLEDRSRRSNLQLLGLPEKGRER